MHRSAVPGSGHAHADTHVQCGIKVPYKQPTVRTYLKQNSHRDKGRCTSHSRVSLGSRPLMRVCKCLSYCCLPRENECINVHMSQKNRGGFKFSSSSGNARHFVLDIVLLRDVSVSIGHLQAQTQTHPSSGLRLTFTDWVQILTSNVTDV